MCRLDEEKEVNYMHRGTAGLSQGLVDRQLEWPVGRCPHCRGEVYRGERLTQWEGGWICPDCFADRVESWLNRQPEGLALALGLDTCRAGGE